MKFLEATLLSIIAVLAPIESIMLTTGVMIFIDLILGIIAAKKLGKLITSAALRRTVSKMLVYQLTLISAFICEKYLLDGILPIVKLVAAVIGAVELKSVFENADIINGGSVFKDLIKQLGSVNDKSDDEEPPKP